MDDLIRLPDEVLAHIFSFLHPKDKLKATSVCHRWLEVFNSYPILLEDVCVCIIACSLKNILKLFSNMTRKFRAFKFMYVDIDEQCFLFLERFGPQFRSLMFVSCPLLVNVDQPGRKIRTCERLLKLTVVNCCALMIFYHLPALKSLRLEINKVSERDLVQMQQMTPLSLTNLLVAENFYSDRDCNTIVSEGVGDFILKRLCRLESLDLFGLGCQGFVMSMLSKTAGSSLKRLRVRSNYLPRNCLESFCKRHQRIVALDLRNTTVSYTFHSITPIIIDSTVVAICNSLPLLEELDISGSIAVNESVAMIFKLKHLRRLSLFGCKGITKVSFINALKGLSCKHLKKINLCNTITNRSTLSPFLPLVPNLREIILDEDYLNDEWVELAPRSLLEIGKTFVRRSLNH